MKLTEKKLVLTVIVIYTLAHGLILLNRGVYWDGWVLYGQNRHLLVDQFSLLGMPWLGYGHYYAQSIVHGVIAYKIITFACFLAAALFLNSILKEITEIRISDRLFIVVMFAVFPVYSARIEMIDLPYTISYGLFFLAFYLLQKYLSKKKLPLRVLSLIGFFLSFTTNSLLLFFALALLYIVYMENKDALLQLKLREATKTLVKYLDFIIAPLLFRAIQTVYLKPVEPFTDYNQIHLSLRRVVGGGLYAFTGSFFDVIWHSIRTSITPALIGVTVPVLIIMFAYCILNRLSVDRKTPNLDILFFAFGIFSLFIGIFPYVVVGKFPTSILLSGLIKQEGLPPAYDWTSRYQLLVPLGASFMFVYGLKLIPWLDGKKRALLLSFFLGLFTVTTISGYIDFDLDWYKQMSLIENFKTNEVIKGHTTFLVEDKTKSFDANNRAYRFYEYSGLFKYAFGNETRLASPDSADISKFTKTKMYNRLFKQYKLSHYRRLGKPEFIIEIEEGQTGKQIAASRLVGYIKLRFYELLFAETRFKREVKNLVTIKTKQV